MSPRRGFFFVKKHVPINLEHVLLGFCHFGSVLGSQEGQFKDFLILILALNQIGIYIYIYIYIYTGYVRFIVMRTNMLIATYDIYCITYYPLAFGLPATVPFLASGGRRPGASRKKATSKPETNMQKPEPWGGPGGSWGRFWRHFGPKTAQSSKILEKVTWRTPPRDPTWQPKSSEILKNCPKDPSREDLETQSGKSCFLEPLRDPPICHPYSKYHAFSTSHEELPGRVWAPFWSLLAASWRQVGSKVGFWRVEKPIKNKHEKRGQWVKPRELGATPVVPLKNQQAGGWRPAFKH